MINKVIAILEAPEGLSVAFLVSVVVCSDFLVVSLELAALVDSGVFASVAVDFVPGPGASVPVSIPLLEEVDLISA